MQSEHRDVLLTSSLLRLDETRGAIDAHDQAASDLGIERAAVASLLDAQNATNPRHDLVRRRVGGLVEVDDTVAHVVVERALERRAAIGNRRVVTRANIELVKVLLERNPPTPSRVRHQSNPHTSTREREREREIRVDRSSE